MNPLFLLVAGGSAHIHSMEANKTFLGPNVYVFDSHMPSTEVQKTLDEIFKKMEANQFGSERMALLFKPGEYKLAFEVGFYTQVSGLGQNPDDVHFDGFVNVPARWMRNANATCNFWRSYENFSVTPSANQGILQIAVSQAAPIRRLHVKGDLRLFAWTADHRAEGWASGGFLADSIVDGKLDSGSQQQWLSRNSRWASWPSGSWNMVFVGCENTPSGVFPKRPFTVVDKTPVVREKPYLYVDSTGAFRVFVPALRRDSVGISWDGKSTPGSSLSLNSFYVAHPETSTATEINTALSNGKHILFTPGIYQLDKPLHISKPNTIMMGLGYATLIPVKGRAAISVDDIDGVKLASLIVDAGETKSPTLVEIGSGTSKVDHSKNPICIYDFTVRTGGATVGTNDDSVRIESNDVIVDHIWVWRADHGMNVHWNTNSSKRGFVVNGNRVTVYGLFNEHHEEFQTLWNGEDGRVYMYQSEMPYDVPDQAAWGTNGFASYKVAEHVKHHEAWGLGIYSFFRDADVRAKSAIEAPNTPGVNLHNMTTIWLTGKQGSEISHVVNELGGAATSKVHKQTLNEFPAN